MQSLGRGNRCCAVAVGQGDSPVTFRLVNKWGQGQGQAGGSGGISFPVHLGPQPRAFQGSE